MTTPPVALVTGAAGGIGRAVVERLLTAGYCVVAEDLSEQVEALAQERLVPLRADVADPESGERAVALAIERFGGLDLLVNNAGLFLRKSLADTTADDWDRLFAINARAPFLHAKAARSQLAERHGSIVNTASISGLVGLREQSVYGATKGALIQLTRALAIELAPDIRVNAVAPGAVDTEFMAEANRGVPPDVLAQRRAGVAMTHPLGRMSQSGEVADAIVFLASPQASGITGTVLSVDGGYVAQ